MYGVDGGICPPFQGNPWMKTEDPVKPLWAVCVKEEGRVGILGIPITMSPEAPARLVGIGSWTTWLTGVKGIVGMLDVGALIGGGSTPSVGKAEVKAK